MRAYAIRAHSALIRVLGWTGPAKVEGSVAVLGGDGLPLPANARTTLAVLVNLLKEFDQQVDAI